MLNRLQAASRLLIRASLALFTAVVLLLIQSAFWSNRVSAWMQMIIVATALLSYFRPQYGLLALAALAPLGQVGSRTLDSQMRGAEALVLAFLAGALLRGWTLREFRNFPSTRLEIAALIFAFVVAASCLEQIWLLQIQRDFPWEFTQQLFAYASRDYLTGFRDFSMIFRAMLLIEGVALLLYTARYIGHQQEFGKRLVVAIIMGATATALLTIAVQLVEARQAAITFMELITKRWTVHVGDVNASGSYFGLTAFIAIGMAFKKPKGRVLWLTAAVLLLFVMLMTGSRTAVAAAGLVGVLLLLRMAASQFSYATRAFSVAAAIVFVIAAAYLVLRTTGATPSQALSIRWAFLRTTVAMLAAQPSFGVGIGQYVAAAGQLAPADLFQFWHPDNAHNNFAQIAGELGLAGFITFVAVLVTSLWRRDAQRGVAILLTPVLLGLYVFMVTWLGGHPLLVAEVSYPFWLTLGIAAAVIAQNAAGRSSAIVAGSVAVLLILTVPFRVNDKSDTINLARVNYGVSARKTMTSRARFFVPASQGSVEFPLRARGASDSDPVEIEVFIDGSAAQTITITNRNWQRTRIDLGGQASGPYRRIDLHITPPAVDDVDTRPPVEVGNWEIIAKPHG